MYKTCPLSCGVCEGSTCADLNVTQCHIWHDSGECEHNPAAVMKECPETCGVCSKVLAFWCLLCLRLALPLMLC